MINLKDMKIAERVVAKITCVPIPERRVYNLVEELRADGFSDLEIRRALDNLLMDLVSVMTSKSGVGNFAPAQCIKRALIHGT